MIGNETAHNDEVTSPSGYSPFGSTPRPRKRSIGGASFGPFIFPLIVVVTAIAGLLAATAATPVGLWVFLLVLGGWLISLCLHEFAHAATAFGGGDTSVRAKGYLTLNPMRYTNTAMTFVLPLVILAIGGIPLPGGAVLIETHRLRTRGWNSLVSLAGPATNLVLGIALAALAGSINNPLGYGLSFLALIQFVAAILNILPVPGLDGWGVIAPYLSPQTRAAVRPLQPWAPFALLIVLISVPQASGLLFDATYWLFELLGGNSYAAGIGSGLFKFWR